MLNQNEFTVLYSKYSCNIVIMPDKIKITTWDKFKFFLLVFRLYICTVYFYCVSAILSFYCPFLLIFILVCFCVFYMSCFVCAAIWHNKR